MGATESNSINVEPIEDTSKSGAHYENITTSRGPSGTIAMGNKITATAAKVLDTVKKLSAQSAMSMNRNERRRLSKVNNGIKIPGTTMPYVKAETKNRKGVINVEYNKV